MQITRESMFTMREELGEEKVKNKIPLWRSRKARFAREWLSGLESKRESFRLLRQEQREDESLSISRKALLISRRSNKIAISAMILSIITAIAITIVQFIFNP